MITWIYERRFIGQFGIWTFKLDNSPLQSNRNMDTLRVFLFKPFMYIYGYHVEGIKKDDEKCNGGNYGEIVEMGWSIQYGGAGK